MNEFHGITVRLRYVGDRPVTVADYHAFAPYYDEINEAWSLGFPSLV